MTEWGAIVALMAAEENRMPEARPMINDIGAGLGDCMDARLTMQKIANALQKKQAAAEVAKDQEEQKDEARQDGQCQTTSRMCLYISSRMGPRPIVQGLARVVYETAPRVISRVTLPSSDPAPRKVAVNVGPTVGNPNGLAQKSCCPHGHD